MSVISIGRLFTNKEILWGKSWLAKAEPQARLKAMLSAARFM